MCVYAQLAVRVNISVKFSPTETFQLHEKFLFVQALTNVIVHNLRSTGVMDWHVLFYLIPKRSLSTMVSKCLKICMVSIVLERHC